MVAEAKASGCLLKAGFIKNTKTFNPWIRTKLITIDMQHMLNQVLKIQISSTHKDSTPSAILKHFKNVNKLKEITRRDYGYDFFANGPVKMINTGKEAPEDVANDIFSASVTGNKYLQNLHRNVL